MARSNFCCSSIPMIFKNVRRQRMRQDAKDDHLFIFRHIEDDFRNIGRRPFAKHFAQRTRNFGRRSCP